MILGSKSEAWLEERLSLVDGLSQLPETAGKVASAQVPGALQW